MDNKFELHHGDCLEVLRVMPDNSVDSIVTDPPYGLSFMGRKWDYDVPSVEIWAECLRVLKPGGHLLAFAGTRTQHRMAVRIEDAGFEIRDMIAWVYGSGFPKSHDVSKAIDREAGVKGDFLGERSVPPKTKNPSFGQDGKNGEGMRFRETFEVTAPSTAAARQWQGWGTALKPALEPITVARKPLIGTVAANVLAHGTGALNIDGCRVGGEDMSGQFDRVWSDNTGEMGGRFSQGCRQSWKVVPPGRWPANFIHDGSDEVLAFFPQSSTTGTMKNAERGTQANKVVTSFTRGVKATECTDSGSASRFFYSAKASKADRDDGLEEFEEQQSSVGDNRTSGDFNERLGKTPGFRKNTHPTVKPTDLMAYLCRLVTPQNGIVLDPFMGSGSTGKAAMREGFNFVGIEREAEYLEIARARIEYELRKSE